MQTLQGKSPTEANNIIKERKFDLRTNSNHNSLTYTYESERKVEVNKSGIVSPLSHSQIPVKALSPNNNKLSGNFYL